MSVPCRRCGEPTQPDADWWGRDMDTCTRCGRGQAPASPSPEPLAETLRICGYCWLLFEPRRSGLRQFYHSERCRVRAYRISRATVTRPSVHGKALATTVSGEAAHG